MSRSDPVGLRLSGLAQSYRLSADTTDRFAAVLALLAAEPRSVTAIRTLEEAADRHVADALSALDLPEVRAARAIADIGSGNGFPGLALAIALPEAHVSLVESSEHKCAFLARAAAASRATNVDVVCARCEAWEDGLGRHDAVTARAVAALPTLVEYAAPLLRVGGVLVAWKGDPGPEEEAGGLAAAERLGMAFDRTVPVVPFAGAERRRLYIYRKVVATPAGFPRRVGVARKRPLG